MYIYLFICMYVSIEDVVATTAQQRSHPWFVEERVVTLGFVPTHANLGLPLLPKSEAAACLGTTPVSTPRTAVGRATIGYQLCLDRRRRAARAKQKLGEALFLLGTLFPQSPT